MSHDAPHDCNPRAFTDTTCSNAATGEQSSPQWTLVMAILASSLAFVDSSIVNVALPAIREDLSATAPQIQWVVNSYTLPLAALLLLGGALGDRYGRKATLVAGTAIFLAGSLLCALVPQLWPLIAGRALQGLGGAMLLPNSLALLNGAFTGEARGKAVGTWAAAGAISGAAAPLAGGWLVENTGWPAIFWLLVPMAIAAIAMAMWKVDEVTSDHAAHTDYSGALTATIGLGALTLALTFWSADGSFNTRTIALLVGGAAFIALFLAIERRKGEDAMMPLALFGGRCVVSLNLLTFLLYGALGGILLILPYLLIESGGYSPTMAGLAIMPFPLIIGIASPKMGAIAEKIGPRIPLTIGPLLVAAGLLLGLRIEEGNDYWTTILPSLLVISLGMALAVAPLTASVMAAVDDSFAGTASGLNNAVSRTGGLIAVALMGGVLALSGAALFDGFHASLWAMAAASALAGVIAALGLGPIDRAYKEKTVTA